MRNQAEGQLCGIAKQSIRSSALIVSIEEYDQLMPWHKKSVDKVQRNVPPQVCPLRASHFSSPSLLTVVTLFGILWGPTSKTSGFVPANCNPLTFQRSMNACLCKEFKSSNGIHNANDDHRSKDPPKQQIDSISIISNVLAYFELCATHLPCRCWCRQKYSLQTLWISPYVEGPTVKVAMKTSITRLGYQWMRVEKLMF